MGTVLLDRQVVNVDHVMPAAGNGSIFVIADAVRLPFRTGSFDGALLKDVLEHVADPVGALAESRRVMGAGGLVTVQVPRALPRAVWADPTHVRGFTSKAIVAALSMAGFEAGRPARMGGFPGAGRLGLIPRLEQIMRIPVLGHWYGTNWLVNGRSSGPVRL